MARLADLRSNPPTLIAPGIALCEAQAHDPEPTAAAHRFLTDAGLSATALQSAEAASTQWRVTVVEALLALGHVSEVWYATVLAEYLSVPFVAWGIELTSATAVMRVNQHTAFRVRLTDGDEAFAVPSTMSPPDEMRGVVETLAQSGMRVVLVTSRVLGEALERRTRKSALRRATFGLLRSSPQLSAARPLATWQAFALAVGAGLFVGGWVVAPGATVAVLLALLILPFMGVVLVRLVALIEVLRPATRAADAAAHIPDAALPTYTVLVPLFDEADVLPTLIAALARLDYPKAKLEVILVLEEVDLRTKAALLHHVLPPNFRAIVVPDAQPRTKPKALNYALQFATGEQVVVFDAEDQPDSDQLRRAVAAFHSGPVNLACVQARLNLHNATDSWLSRQFTVEYSALFDAILPALDRLGLPVPLGGTSNHFRRVLLDELGGWDPFNVTEDADLGIRLARLGYVTQVLDSTTWEEAPTTWAQWLPQRTRWLKGWYQTYLVHTRQPSRLLGDLGLWQTLGFHVFLGGLILSTLMHPVFYLLVAWTWLFGDTLAVPELFGGRWLWLLTGGNLCLGYFSAIAVGVIAARRRGHGLVLAALQMPVAWLLISVAAYRALWQLWRDPYLWEKTTHSAPHRQRGAVLPKF
jgi:glycosyltransferase XagB